MADSKPYHHGDLRAALLGAAEQELAARGVEAFSLRSVAKRAGVSHAAPAHHFGDTGGLLTALAADGFRRFLGFQHRRETAAAADPVSQLVGAGLGYIDFAMAHPALFRLIFTSARINREDLGFQAAAKASFQHLLDVTRAAGGNESDIPAVWAGAHGLADLLMSGQLSVLARMQPADRDRALATAMMRSFPSSAHRQHSV
jgi:AcrR family transcriptional regulator